MSGRDEDQLIWWRGYDRGKGAGFQAGLLLGFMLMGLVTFIFLAIR